MLRLWYLWIGNGLSWQTILISQNPLVISPQFRWTQKQRHFSTQHGKTFMFVWPGFEQHTTGLVWSNGVFMVINIDMVINLTLSWLLPLWVSVGGHLAAFSKFIFQFTRQLYSDFRPSAGPILVKCLYNLSSVSATLHKTCSIVGDIIDHDRAQNGLKITWGHTRGYHLFVFSNHWSRN